MRIRTARIYDKPSPKDGYRLLVMRLWPRGVRKDDIDEWQKELAASRELLRSYLDGDIAWSEMARRYRAEMRKKPELLDSVRKLAKRRNVILICACKDASRCHRTLLKKLLEK